MSHSLECPECGHRFTLKLVKPGRYKPACTACKKSFSLVASGDEPVRIQVSRLTIEGVVGGSQKKGAPKTTETVTDHAAAQRRNTPAAKSSSAAPSAATPSAPSTAAHRDESIGGTGGGSLDATMDGELPTQQASKAPPAKPTTQRAGNVTAGTATRVAAEVAEQTMDVAPSSTQRTGNIPVGSDGEALPPRMGGYRILGELGRGGMGAVYLAKQVSLDRKVALKTIRGGWSDNPRAVARFIREAYAAAQLTHHNVVQIYDLGEEKGTNFFSMELVGGGSLQDLMKKQGRIAPNLAAALIAQAARGLKFAHDHGMVHRDIKPANLMLTGDGMVKVADLGLVKTPTQSDDLPIESDDVNPALSTARSNVTDAGSTMGTPAYMAPEQARDATQVDHRADIYSLGCTLYALLTGHPPFHTAKSAREVAALHRESAFPSARSEVAEVPADLDRIVQKMTAKQPQQRYSDLGEVVVELEKIAAAGEACPSLVSEQNIGRLTAIVQAFNKHPLLPVRRFGPLLLGLVAALLLVACLLMGQFRAASAVLIASATFPVALSVISGMAGSAGPVGGRVRSLLLDSRWSEWATWAAGLLLIAGMALALGLAIWWIGAILLGAAMAAGWHFGILKQIDAGRGTTVAQATKLLRSFRVAGFDEPSVRSFVAEHSGKDWEEFFENLFDYDTLRTARQTLGEQGKLAGRRKFAAWRDPVINWISSLIQERKSERDQKVLEKAERAGLRAEGKSDAEARRLAFANAASLVDAAAMAREGSKTEAGSGSADAAAAKRDRIKAMLLAARSGAPTESHSLSARARDAAMIHFLGGKLRFLLAAGLIAGSVFWAKQSGFLEIESLKSVSSEIQAKAGAVQGADLNALRGLVPPQLTEVFEPWSFPVVGGLFRSLAPALLGIVVLCSAFATGWRYSLIVIPAVFLGLLGPSLGVPSLGVGQGAEWLSAMGGSLLIVVGGFVLKRIFGDR